MRTANVNLYGKPYERLILQAIARKYNCEFNYDERTGFCTLIGEKASSARRFYSEIVVVAYKQLAFAQAKNKFASVPIKTLNSEFMRGFASIACGLIDENTIHNLTARTEVERAGMLAAKEKCPEKS